MENLKHALIADFDSGTRILSLKADSIPDNAIKFFKPLSKWVKEFVKQHHTKAVVNISIVHIHIGAAKQIYDLLKLLSEWKKKGNILAINWYYKSDDQDMELMGMNFSVLLKTPFNLIKIKD